MVTLDNFLYVYIFFFLKGFGIGFRLKIIEKSYMVQKKNVKQP